MTSIKKNLTVNLLGKVWTTLMSVIFLPYYIKLIGVEAYGLVGVYTALIALFGVLDLGLGNTMNREMARMSSKQEVPESFHHLTRSFELIYWSMALLIGVAIYFAAPFLSEHWINAKELSSDTVRQAIYCIGAALAFIWPSSLYSGGLMGLQKQVLLNTINIIIATLRGLGMVLVLTFISPTIEAFFLWQLFINILQTGLTAFFLWKNLPRTQKKARIDLKMVWQLKRFAMGIAGSTLLATVLAQMDKVILSKFLSLDVFGYYTLATTIAGALFYITVPIFSVFFPHFTQLIYSNDQEELKRTYHIGCQILSAFIIPSAVIAILFSSELLYAWTQNAITVENTHFLVKLLMISTMLNALMTIPFALQLAHGWTKLSFYMNLFGCVLMLPLLLWVTPLYKEAGAASLCIGLNALFFLANLQFMYRKILKAEKWRWFVQDIALPFLAVLAIASLGRWCFPIRFSGMVATFSYLFLIYVLSFLAAIAVSTNARNWLLEGLRKQRPLIFKNDI